MTKVALCRPIFLLLWEDIETKLNDLKITTTNREIRYSKLRELLMNIVSEHNLNGSMTSDTLYKKMREAASGTKEIINLTKSPLNRVFFLFLDCNNLQEFLDKNASRIPHEVKKRQVNLNLTTKTEDLKSERFHGSINSFSSRDEFESYLKNKLLDEAGKKKVDQVKVVHFSDRDIYSSESELNQIVENFLDAGGSWERMISVPQNQNIHTSIEDELNKFENKRYYVRIINNILMREAGVYSFIIIENTEVCIGGTYFDGDIPTIVHRDPRVVDFYLRYYNQLTSFSIPIKETVHQSLERKIQQNKEWESFKLTSLQLGNYFIREFKSDKTFNDYIEERYKTIGAVKIIAFSNNSNKTESIESKRFDKILNDWLKDDTKKCIHINSKRDDEGKKRLLERARNSEGKTDHSIYYLNKANFGHRLGHFEMILDKKEVYFRNSTLDEDKNSVSIIGTNQPEMVKIWCERFDNLKDQAEILKSGIHFVNEKALQDSIMEELEDEDAFYDDLESKIKLLAKDKTHKIHSISFINEESDNPRFERIREKFLEDGNEFISIRGRKPKGNLNNIIDKLNQYNQFKYYYYYLDQIAYGDIQGLSVIILNDQLVYFQNGKGIPGSTIIACNEDHLIKFWKNRFEYLKSQASIIKSPDSPLNTKLLINN